MSIEEQLERLSGPPPRGLTEGVALGTGLADGYDVYESPIGDVVVTFNPEGVTSVELAEEDFVTSFTERFHRPLLRAEAPKAWARHIRPALEAGRPGKVPVDLSSVTPFQQEVLRATATIPKGEVRSYSWIAAQADRPRAVRAAGSSVASNPIPLIIPCHRVVRADGHVGKYSLGGPHNKWELLEHEGANPIRLEELASDHVRVQGNKNTGVFCYPTCRAIRRTRPENLIPFRTVEDAEGAGFEACTWCKPCC
jgi:O-6-methylguanine DNA methyltransferase